MDRGVLQSDLDIRAEFLGVHNYEYRDEKDGPRWNYVAGHKRGRDGAEAIYLNYRVQRGVSKAGGTFGVNYRNEAKNFLVKPRISYSTLNTCKKNGIFVNKLRDPNKNMSQNDALNNSFGYFLTDD